MSKINPNLLAATRAADQLTNALAELRYNRSLDDDAREELMRRISCAAHCLNALAFNNYDHAWQLLRVWRSELFRLGIAQELDSFAGQTAETSVRSNP